ncbi:cytosine methyltransferase [Pseudomonas sp. CFBP13528]|uniref:DNA (cytosine-5-)-methyltransferase n=1 Tax=Pseudomonas sp. CFBP13528 TaxID=2184006 RepID=UPI0010C044A2|nr:DNA cytosine methyltransferase [Pseudomonas sp. CFBP13528]TKK29525.1 cytosine methyltransferase [Pseudomonas sp. CFBP13528]
MPDITYGSVCSGIEAATQAWHPLGMRAAWFAEIEPFPSAVLAHHYPDVPNHGDMTKLAALVLAGKIPAPDVLVGGTPCQAFSVAGMREGLTDPRGALTIKYVELADAVDYVRAGQRKPASVIVWENVPGVLSDKGNAFGCFLGALAGEDCELQPPGKKWQDAGCVYGPKRTIAWRVLDAQYFGLAQRRRRVFVVASARDGFDPTEVLFEREGVRRDTAPRRGEGQDVTGTAPFGPALQCGCGSVFAESLGQYGCPNCEGDEGPAIDMFGGIPAFGGHSLTGSIERAATLTAKGSRLDVESETFFVVHGTQDPCVSVNQAHALGRNSGQENVLYCREIAQTVTSNYGKQLDNTDSALGPNIVAELSPTLRSGNMRNNSNPTTEVSMLVGGSAVRRLTPVECERLQGMADDYTLIPWRGKSASECPDGPRYKAIGNSKAVTVVRWIGCRLLQQL